jgi:hypothetical protein
MFSAIHAPHRRFRSSGATTMAVLGCVTAIILALIVLAWEWHTSNSLVKPGDRGHVSHKGLKVHKH